MPLPIPLLSPWQKPHSPQALAEELHREVSPQHELYGLPIRALAVARDRDDILFEVGELENNRYAVVHLTWSEKIESHHDSPGTEFFTRSQTGSNG